MAVSAARNAQLAPVRREPAHRPHPGRGAARQALAPVRVLVRQQRQRVQRRRGRRHRLDRADLLVGADRHRRRHPDRRAADRAARHPGAPARRAADDPEPGAVRVLRGGVHVPGGAADQRRVHRRLPGHPGPGHDRRDQRADHPGVDRDPGRPRGGDRDLRVPVDPPGDAGHRGRRRRGAGHHVRPGPAVRRAARPRDHLGPADLRLVPGRGGAAGHRHAGVRPVRVGLHPLPARRDQRAAAVLGHLRRQRAGHVLHLRGRRLPGRAAARPRPGRRRRQGLRVRGRWSSWPSR